MSRKITRFTLIGGACIALLLFAGAPAQAQAVPAAPAPATPPAALTVLNRQVMTFRASLLGLSPADRAEAAGLRINGQLRLGGPGLVTTRLADGGTAIYLDGKLAFMVLDGDANPLLEETPADVARAAVAVLTTVARESREAQSFGARVRAGLWSVLYLTIWAAAIFVLIRFRRGALAYVTRATHRRTRTLTVAGTPLVTQRHARLLAERSLNAVYWIVMLLVSYQMLGLLLIAFPYTRPWGERLEGFLVNLLVRTASSIANAVPGLLVVAVIVIIARVVLGVTRRLFTQIDAGRLEVHWLDRDLAQPTQRLFNAAVILFALAMAYPYLPGSGSAAFNGLSVLVGLMVSLGGASSVGQSIAGLMLMYSRTLRVGDYVRIDEIEGSVTSLTTMQTRLRTGTGEEVSIANSRVVSAVVRNYSRTAPGAGTVLETSVTIGYDAPWRQVHALLIDAAARTEGISTDPQPRVLQTALADFYVEYRLVCHIVAGSPLLRVDVKSHLHANIQDGFNKAGLQIMSPHYVGDPAAPKIVPVAQWQERP